MKPAAAAAAAASLLLFAAFSWPSVLGQQTQDLSGVQNSYPSISSFSGIEGFSTLEAVLSVSGLYNTLQDGSLQYTIFAPTDLAFIQFLNASNFQLIDLLKSDYLKSIIQYHTVSYKIPTSSIQDGMKVDTQLSGQQLTLLGNSATGTHVVQAAESYGTIVKSDISAGQSLVQVIDAVLVPPVSALEQATYNKQLGDANANSK